MDASAHTRRTQFSSCDACRRSRTACNASQLGYQPGDTDWAGSCSRCSSRSCRCTFKWIKNAKKPRGPLPRNTRAQMPLVTEDSFVPWGQLVMPDSPSGADGGPIKSSENSSVDPSGTGDTSPPDDNVNAELAQWSEDLFHQCLGSLYGHWLGVYGCPLTTDQAGEVCIPPVELFHRLDRLMSEEADMGDPTFGPQSFGSRRDAEAEIHQSLQLAIRAHAAYWLPTIVQNVNVDVNRMGDYARNQWRAARREMLRVINRLCYRSVLTLALFGQTPVPAGVSEQEELDGITGSVCIQTALKQVQQLRGRLRTWQFDGSDASPWTDAPSRGPSRQAPRALFLDLESRAYWAAVSWDTSAALTTNARSSLITGLRGGCSEPAWVLTKGFLVDSFHFKSESWRRPGVEMSDDIATQIISASGVSRLYVWRTIASLREGLMEGENEQTILFAWRAVIDALDIFDNTIRPSLDNCKRQLHFLTQKTRFNYYESVTRYYLGILILYDTLEAAHRQDLLSEIVGGRLDAEHESINALKFGLESTYSLGGPPASASSHSRSSKASFVAVDPYPHFVIASTRLLSKAINRRYSRGNIEYDAYAHLSSTLVEALRNLPQHAKSVQSARENLERCLHDAGDAR